MKISELNHIAALHIADMGMELRILLRDPDGHFIELFTPESVD